MNQSQPNSAKDKPTKGEAENASPSVSEGEDFYLEGGLMVFTERFLLKRG